MKLFKYFILNVNLENTDKNDNIKNHIKINLKYRYVHTNYNLVYLKHKRGWKLVSLILL
jgi:hypothetical protein